MALMDAIDFAWVVGLYEGEGTCYLTTNRVREKNRGQSIAFVTLTMADLEPLARAHEITGLGRLTGPYVRRTENLGKAPMYWWRICAQNQVVTFLEAAWPMLSQRRREQAEPVLAWAKQRLADRAAGKYRYAHLTP